MQINHIYCGDCLKVMVTEISASSIDLVYADPPYNLSGKSLTLQNNQTGGPFYKMNEDWDTWNYEDYLEFSENWISKVRIILKNIHKKRVVKVLHIPVKKAVKKRLHLFRDLSSHLIYHLKLKIW